MITTPRTRSGTTSNDLIPANPINTPSVSNPHTTSAMSLVKSGTRSGFYSGVRCCFGFSVFCVSQNGRPPYTRTVADLEFASRHCRDGFGVVERGTLHFEIGRPNWPCFKNKGERELIKRINGLKIQVVVAKPMEESAYIFSHPSSRVCALI